jgi:pimeloyl-ACP methyl ester carboxylesterase
MHKKAAFQLVFGIILILISTWQVYAAQEDLDIINLHESNPPVTIITPSKINLTSRPTILIAHGFAGSSVIMRGFALTLAHAGYTTISWDFQGHGENSSLMDPTTRANSLLQDTEAAISATETHYLIDTQRIAIIGHSMGSGVALSFGLNHPDTAATITISPVNQAVTHDLPKNLLLMAGSLEPQFAANAEELMINAGGQGGALNNGSARNLVIIPNVEHISILFSPQAHSTARFWLDGTFGVQPGATTYTDRRILWYSLGILGFILAANTCINLLSAPTQIKTTFRPLWIRIAAIITGSLAATFLLWLVSLLGIKTNQLFGLLVGGYLVVWFGIAGLVSLLIVRPKITWPESRELVKALFTFLSLWLGVGLIGHFVWLPWLLIPSRLWLVLPCSILLLPWFVSIGHASKGAKPASQLGWWIFQVTTIIIGLLLAIQLNPELSFLFIILPLIPVMLGLHMLIISPKHGIWAYSLSGALFTTWLILAVFPLQ